MRRVKEDVLRELPPRIIEDFFCAASPHQIDLIEALDRRGAGFSLDSVTQKRGEKGEKGESVLKGILLHRRVASHPCLAGGDPHALSGKVDGLVSLLESLEMIEREEEGVEEEEEFIKEGQEHKAIIFFQFVDFLHLVEREVCERYKINYITLTANRSLQ